MAIGELFDKIKGDKKTPKQFLALELTDEVVQAAVWSVQDGKTEVVTIGSPVEWDGQGESELLSACDATVSGALEGLEQEPSEVVFGLDSSWTTGEGISREKGPLIKKICAELELKPLGYVVIIDSIIRYLKLQEGTPTTSLMIQVYKDSLTLIHVYLGNLQASTKVGRSDNIVADVEEALSQLPKVDNFPSKILVFNSMHSLDELVQSITANDWQAKYSFLHVPSVSALPKDVAIRSVAVAGGAEVAKSLGLEIRIDQPIEDEGEKQAEDPVEDPVEDQVVEQELVSASDLGFGQEVGVEVSDDFVVEKLTPKITLPKFKLPHLSLPKLGSLPRLSLGIPGKPLYLVLGITSLLIAGYFALGWYLPKAVVTVHVDTKPLDETIKLTLSTSTSTVDQGNNIIPAKLVDTEVSGQSSVATTGDKTVGEPAKGEITIYNRTSLPKTFDKDTVVTSGSLKFTLDKDVVVASKSAGVDYVDVPGKAKVTITAKDIGEDSNLKENTEFTVGSWNKDTYVAQNDSALSGGSSREVKVVTNSDKQSIIDSLTATLATQAKTDLESQVGDGVGIYVLADDAEVVDSSYSSGVGDEATELSGTLTLKLKAMQYSSDDVASLVSSLSDSHIPPGFTRTLTSPTVVLGDIVSSSDKEVEAEAKVSLELIPTTDPSAVAKLITGKTTSEAESILAGLANYNTSNLIITPTWLPTRWLRLPRNPNNITVKIQAI